MADTSKPGNEAAAPIPRPVPNPEAPTSAGLPVEKRAAVSPWRPIEYVIPQSKSRLRSFREAYGFYGVWLICSGLLACSLGLIAYRLDHDHFWFHVCIEFAIASLMLVLTVMLVERMLEYRREQERKERWSLIRNDTFVSLDTILMNIVRFSIIDLLDEPIPSTGMHHTQSAYDKVAQDLTEKNETLKDAKDAKAMQEWAHKMLAWHNTLAPVFNMLRTVTIPQFLHSTRNRTLLRIVLGLEDGIRHSDVFMIELRRPDFSTSINFLVTSNLDAIARIVKGCALIRYYLEQARNCGVKDIDDWADY